MGTLQSTLTNLPYVRKGWVDNTAEERLLGVSLTGIQDCPALRNATPEELQYLREIAKETNFDLADKLAIPRSSAITTVKPSGTVSQLVSSSSGIHPGFARHYVRRVRNAVTDPLTQFMIDQGVPNEIDVTNPNTIVFSFPQSSPSSATLTNKITAIQQLEQWLKFKENWSEHSVSITVYVKPDEWVAVGAWVYEHFDSITGISFLPYSDHTYAQAPYEAITEEQYNELLSSSVKTLDWSLMSSYESTDQTEGAQTLACTSGQCEI